MGGRIRIFIGRTISFLTGYPQRVLLLLKWIFWIGVPAGRHRLWRWLAGMLMLITDLTPLALAYMTILDVVKRKTRPISQEEIQAGKMIFGNQFPWHLISIDPDSIPVKNGWTKAYVQFFTINFYQVIPTPVLLHELTHIWQYQKFGSVYITESLWAQRWGGGYDYGGQVALEQLNEGQGLLSFNFEQQADIIEDYFRAKQGLTLQWAENTPEIQGHLEQLVKVIS